MNYEQEVGEVLLDELKRIYNHSTDELHPYLMCRFILEQNKQKKTPDTLLKKQFMDYILSQLEIKAPIFKKEALFFGYHTTNSLSKVLDFWWESEGLDEESLNKAIWRTVKKAKLYSFLKHLRYRNDENYKELVKLGALKEIEEYFGIQRAFTPKKLEGFEYPIHFTGNHTLEQDEYMELLKNSPYYKEPFTEEDIREYLYHNMEELEDGLHIKNKDKRIKSSYVDFIARDENGQLTLINIMHRKTKDTIYNVDFYRNELSKLYDEDHVRVILLLAYRDAFLETHMKNVDIIYYKPILRFGKLKSVKFTKAIKE